MRTEKTFKELFPQLEGIALVNRPESVAYVTGFYTTARRPGQIGLTCAVMSREQIWLFCPLNWSAEAGKQLKDDSIEVIGYPNGKEELARLILEKMAEEALIPQVGIEPEFMDYELSLAMKEKNDRLSFVSISEELKYAKAIKSAGEIAALKKSAHLAQEAMEYARTLVRPGIREYEMAAEIEHYMRYRGSDGTPFTMKALSGKNTAVTINIPGIRAVCEGDLVLFDFGATVDHYISDWTRTFCCGKANRDQQDLYQLVWQMERMCIDRIRPGVVIRDLMDEVLAMAAGHRFGKWFKPFLGHSIGLASSEWPLMNPGVNTVLEEGMVLTIEPGVYVPGIGGVRIEDEVLVTGDSCEVWTGLKEEAFEVYNQI